MILEDVSFRIKADEYYASVGENGCGKSRIMKLLVGLYDGYEGCIMINGKELREYESGELKALIHIQFQDFAKYPISIKDNMRLGTFEKDKEEEVGKIV